MFAECVVLYEHGFRRSVVTNSPRLEHYAYMRVYVRDRYYRDIIVPNGIHSNLIRDEQFEIAVIKISLLCICAARRRARHNC